MGSALPTSATFLPFHEPKLLNLLPSSSNAFTLTSTSTSKIKTHKRLSIVSITANFSSNHEISPSNGFNKECPFARTLRSTVGTLVLTVAATLMAAKFKDMPAKAEPLPLNVESVAVEEEKAAESRKNPSGSEVKYPLSELMESNDEFVENLMALLLQKLDIGEDEEALKILGKLVEAQPSQMEWKFLMARFLSELGKTQEARDVLEEILAVNPLNFEALSENALLMDRCGEGDAVIARLEKALRIAEDEKKTKEARDVRLIMAQIQFVQKNIDEALQSYEELSKEDPEDYRPYFCKGIIYSLLDRSAEAKEEFAKYKELSPHEFGVEEFLGPDFRR